MRYIPLLFCVASVTAFAFLGYTLANLARLGIRPCHPRVLVEAGLGIAFLTIACLLWH